MDLDKIEKLPICPYIIPKWNRTEKNIEYMLRKYPLYWDFVLFELDQPKTVYRFHFKEK